MSFGAMLAMETFGVSKSYGMVEKEEMINGNSAAQIHRQFVGFRGMCIGNYLL